MNKFTYAAISLIGAVPGGFLAYFSVMAMINYFRDMTGMMRVVACVTTAASALMTVMPLGIVIFTKPKSKEEEEEDAEDASEAQSEEPAEASEVDLELGAVDDEEAEPAISPDEAESEESVVMDTEGMLDEEDVDEADEEPAEEAPKKKK